MDTLLGWIGVVILFYPWWSPRCRRKRKELAGRLHTPSVSRNTRIVRPNATVALPATTGTGPLWEQDTVWTEVFEDVEIGDDL